MLLQDFRKEAVEKLREIYGEREASQMVNILLEDLLQVSRTIVITQPDRVLTVEEQDLLKQALSRLQKNEPLQYITGQAFFYGLTLQVNPSVLIPRPETEELVDWILKDHPNNTTINLLDVGSGSGCIPLALKSKRLNWKVTSIDASEKALETARQNSQTLKLDVAFEQLDFLNEDEWTRFDKLDILVSNPPYITLEEFSTLETHVKEHEPEMALVAPGQDPFIFYRKLAKLGKQKLVDGGHVYLELNADHAATIRDIYIQQGYSDVLVKKDMQKKDRMLRATLK